MVFGSAGGTGFKGAGRFLRTRRMDGFYDDGFAHERMFRKFFVCGLLFVVLKVRTAYWMLEGSSGQVVWAGSMMMVSDTI